MNTIRAVWQGGVGVRPGVGSGTLGKGEGTIARAGRGGGGRQVMDVADQGEEAGVGGVGGGGRREAGLVREVYQLGGLRGNGDLWVWAEVR